MVDKFLIMNFGLIKNLLPLLCHLNALIMPIDIKALRDSQAELASRGGDGLFLYQKDITDATDIRLLPPLPNLKGKYFMELITFWINKEKYISPASFGLACPIMEEIEEAKSSRDKELKALLEDRDCFQKKFEYLMPVLLLEVKLKGEKVTAVTVKGRKILSCGTKLVKAINAVVISRAANANEKEDGVMDMEKGMNIVLGKTGKGLDTDYTAQLDVEWEMEEKWYKDIPDVIKWAEDSLFPADYLRGVIRNYLYGDEMPEKPVMKKREGEEKKSDKKDETVKKRGAGKGVKEDETEPETKRRGASPEKKVENKADGLSEKEKEARRKKLLHDLEALD